MRRVFAVLAIAVVAGCGNGSPPTPPPDLPQRLQALWTVCQDGRDPAAPNYAQNDDHRAVVFEGKGQNMIRGYERLPEDQTMDASTGEGLDEVDVVVCGERIAAKPVRLCDDSGGQKDAIKWHTATYSFTARSARTGKPLGKSKTIKATNTTCPTNVSVGKDYIPLDQYAVISKSDLKEFAEPYLDR
jgi:hypothetical protein